MRISKIKYNKSGFTLVEMVVTVAILLVLATISGAPLVNLYKARAKAASSEISAMLSQSKINTLSGIANEMELRYDTDKGVYKCELYYLDDDGNRKENTDPYKTEEVGGKKLEISVGEIDDNSNTVVSSASIKESALVVRFSNQTGRVNAFDCDTVSAGNKSNVINIDSSSEYIITLYSKTGEQVVELNND